MADETIDDLTLRPPVASERNESLDGLRGYAAAAVVIYHSILGPNPDLIPDVLYRGIQSQHTGYGAALKVALSLINGEIAVGVFFVISGIVLFRAANHLRARDGGLRMSWSFSLRRVLRIWPVLAVYLVAHWTLFAALHQRWPDRVQRFSWAQLADNLLLLDVPVNAATWTLLWELIATPIIVVGVCAAARFGRWAMPASVLLLLLALSGLFPLGLHSPPLLATMPFLAAGMAIECGWFRPLTVPARRGPAAVVALVVLLASILFISPAEHFLRHFLLIVLTLPVLVAVAATSGQGVLRARPSQILGRLSFSLYLWNVPIFELIFAWLDPALVHAHPLECGLLVGVVTILLTLPLAHLSERAIERPAIALGRALTRHRRTTVVQPAPAASV